MNTKLLRRIKSVIKAEPKRLDMGAWTYRNVRRSGPPCGTVGCIAGWAVLLSTKGRNNKERYENADPSDWAGEGRRLLKLDAGEAHKLFFVGCWPYELHEAYDDAYGDPKARAKITCERIDRFIESKGRE